MLKGKCIFVAGVLALALVTPVSVRAQSVPAPYHPDRVLLVPKAGAGKDLENLRTRKGHAVRSRFDDLGVQVLKVSGRDPAEVAREYQASGLVEFAEPDYRIGLSVRPNDPGYTNCWGLHNASRTSADIRAELGWERQRSAEGIIVAVIDSGVRYTHEDLAANMWRNPREIANGKDDDGNGIIDDLHGFDALNGTGDPMDQNGHGTHVAGTIGAVGNNAKGLAGVAWRTQIMALKFMDETGWGDTSAAIACLNYARRNGATVVNASWGSGAYSYALRNAINSARKAGMIVVAAAGNEGSNIDSVPSYPASYNLDNIISVAALTSSGRLDTSYSNWGSTSVDLAAPGTGIYSTSARGDDQYEYMAGTSMAAPYVTGAVALLQAAYPGDTYQQTVARLLAGVESVSALEGKCATGGRLSLADLFPGKRNLVLRRTGEGSVTASPEELSYAPGSIVEVLATPASGYAFAGWTGDLQGTNNPVTVLMDSDKQISADFVQEAIVGSNPSALQAFGLFPTGFFYIELAQATQDLVVESSTDLIQWEPLPHVTRNGTRINIPPSGERQRFFRVRNP